MPESPLHLHPIFDRVVRRAEKEARLRQRARVIWLFGLSGAGKSTLAIGLEQRLQADGCTTQVLDGDNLRTGLNRDLGFSDKDRDENIRRVAEVAKLFLQAGVITICSFITPARQQRASARSIIGADDLLEVYVRASLQTCAARDPKGLYAKAQAGEVPLFTGKDSSFEPPSDGDPGYTIVTDGETAERSLQKLHALVAPRIQFT